jgi:hypothetical protein
MTIGYHQKGWLWLKTAVSNPCFLFVFEATNFFCWIPLTWNVQKSCGVSVAHLIWKGRGSAVIRITLLPIISPTEKKWVAVLHLWFLASTMPWSWSCGSVWGSQIWSECNWTIMAATAITLPMCWNTLYICMKWTWWVWSGWGDLISTNSMIQVWVQENHLQPLW